MNNKCNCYHAGVCGGVKERLQCSCKGNEIECDYYPEVRERARKSITIEDAINHFKYGISHDIFSEPVITYAKMAIEALEKQNAKESEKTYEDITFIEDCLIIGVDISPKEDSCLVVMKRENDKAYVVNLFRDEEAIALYKKLIRKLK